MKVSDFHFAFPNIFYRENVFSIEILNFLINSVFLHQENIKCGISSKK